MKVIYSFDCKHQLNFADSKMGLRTKTTGKKNPGGRSKHHFLLTAGKANLKVSWQTSCL